MAAHPGNGVSRGSSDSAPRQPATDADISVYLRAAVVAAAALPPRAVSYDLSVDVMNESLEDIEAAANQLAPARTNTSPRHKPTKPEV